LQADMTAVAPANHPKSCAATSPPPVVWLLLGHKAGDNNQVLALAESLDLPFFGKKMDYRRTEILSNVLLGPNLLGTKRPVRKQLGPPWPDLVITAGRRNEPVARWIRQQADQEVRLVHVGRPWADPDVFDLIVTTPQYLLDDRPNVLRIELPLHRINRELLDEAAGTWRSRLASLPEPRIALLVGGVSGAFQLDPHKARRLGRAASRLAAGSGGSLMVTTSARTPAAAVRALRETIDVPSFFYEWQQDAADNPYLALLALADEFVVTGESMSMLTEACATCRPVHIFDMQDPPIGAMGLSSVGRLRERLRRMVYGLGYRPLTHRLGQRLAPVRLRRDVGRLHDSLVCSGRAVWLGDQPPDARPPPLPRIEVATARVRQLLGLPEGGET
jgi:mitochondrial fission protein ELM1